MLTPGESIIRGVIDRGFQIDKGKGFMNIKIHKPFFDG